MTSALHSSSVRKDGSIVVLVMVCALLIAFFYPIHCQAMAVAQEANSSGDPRAETQAPATSTPRGEPSVLTAVQALPGSVELSFSAPVEFRKATLPGGAERAGRFYVDVFPASLIRRRGSTLKVASGPVQRVRTSLFRPGVVRVVLDLREERHFQVETLTNPYRLVITAQQKGGAKPDAQTSEAGQASLTSARNVADKIAQPHLASALTWRTLTQPWTLMLHSHPTAIEKTSAPLSFTTPADGAGQTRPDVLDVSSERRADESDAQRLVSIPDFASDRGQPLPLASPALQADEWLSPRGFAMGWGWENVCQDGDCARFAVRRDEGIDAEPAPAPRDEAPSMPVEREQQFVDAATQPVQEAIRTGGTMMREFWMAAMTAGVFLSFLAGVGVVVLWNRRKRSAPTEKSDGWEGRMAYLEEAVNRAGVLNNSFFHSLEVSQKRLESLLTQADIAEQSLRRLLHQTAFAGERSPGRGADALVTAASLLAEGEEMQQVARLLKLPVAQVRLLQEIRQCTQGEKSADPPAKSTVHAPPVDAASSLSNSTSRLNGAARNGIHLAQSEQSL